MGCVAERRGDLIKAGLGRQIIVPNVVMNDLISPNQCSGFAIERHDRICVIVVAGPVATEKVRARR